jgi:hypothetical protein
VHRRICGGPSNRGFKATVGFVAFLIRARRMLVTGGRRKAYYPGRCAGTILSYCSRSTTCFSTSYSPPDFGGACTSSERGKDRKPRQIYPRVHAHPCRDTVLLLAEA